MECEEETTSPVEMCVCVGLVKINSESFIQYTFAFNSLLPDEISIGVGEMTQHLGNPTLPESSSGFPQPTWGRGLTPTSNSR